MNMPGTVPGAIVLYYLEKKILMNSKAVYNGRGKYIGNVVSNNESGVAYGRSGKKLGTWAKTSGFTYDENNKPYGSGNLLEALVFASDR